MVSDVPTRKMEHSETFCMHGNGKGLSLQWPASTTAHRQGRTHESNTVHITILCRGATKEVRRDIAGIIRLHYTAWHWQQHAHPHLPQPLPGRGSGCAVWHRCRTNAWSTSILRIRHSRLGLPVSSASVRTASESPHHHHGTLAWDKAQGRERRTPAGDLTWAGRPPPRRRRTGAGQPV